MTSTLLVFDLTVFQPTHYSSLSRSTELMQMAYEDMQPGKDTG